MAEELFANAESLAVDEVLPLLRYDQRQRWQLKEQVPAEIYVQIVLALELGRDCAFEMVYQEFLLREELRQSPDLEEYARRFPDFAVKLRQQVELHRVLGLHDAPAAQPAQETELAERVAAPWPIIPGYEITAELGQGGMGTVYKAVQCSLQRPVALKVMRWDRLGKDQEMIMRFQRESQAIARLSHPNIVTVYDAAQHEEVYYLAMEYLEGTTLEELVEKSGPLPVRVACDYISQAAWALQHASERGLVHRDIKPANLFVTEPSGQEGPPVVKVLDLGLARMLSMDENECDNRLTQAGDLLGTPHCMAPEQILDSRNADIRADLYSLGCTFYFVLSGKMPFDGDSTMEILDKHRWQTPPPIQRLQPNVPQVVANVIRKLLAKRPAERYSRPAQLALALEPVVQKSFAASAGPEPTPRQPTTTTQPAATTTQPAASTLPPTLSVNESATLRKLKTQLAAQIEKNNPLAAGNTIRAILREKPDDSDALSARALLQEYGADKVGLVLVLQGHSQGVTCVGLTPDGQRAVSGSLDQTIRLWDLPSRREVSCLKGQPGSVQSLALATDGRRLLSAVQDLLSLWDLETGKELRRYKGYRGAINCVSLSGDGRRALTACRSNAVQLWEVETGKLLNEFKGHHGEVYWVAFSSSGTRALSCSRDSTARVWNLPDGGPAGCFRKPPLAILCAALSSDDSQVVLGCSDQTVYLADLKSEREQARLVGHTDKITAVAFAPAGSSVLSASADRTIRLWDPKSASATVCLEGHTDGVSSLAISGDGRLVLSGSKDKTVRLWRLPQ